MVDAELAAKQWREWVARITSGASAHAIGRRLGHSHTTVLAWLRRPTYRAVIELAIEYEADVVFGLVSAGFLSRADLNRIKLDETLKIFSLPKLTAEVHRRAVELTLGKGL